MRKLTLSFSLILLACAAPVDADREATESGQSGQELTLAPIVLLPIPFISLTPAWARACGEQSTRFVLRTASCADVAAKGGYWDARPIFPGLAPGGGLCEVTWRKYISFYPPGREPPKTADAPPDYAALERIAQRDPRDPFGDQMELAIRAVCSDEPTCGAAPDSCTSRPVDTTPRPWWEPIDGMSGCSACAFTSGSDIYAMLPPSWTTSPVRFDLGAGQSIVVNPAGAQVFSVPLATATSSRYVTVTRAP